jgi:hypothetical protein
MKINVQSNGNTSYYNSHYIASHRRPEMCQHTVLNDGIHDSQKGKSPVTNSSFLFAATGMKYFMWIQW